MYALVGFGGWGGEGSGVHGHKWIAILGSSGTYELECHLIADVRYMEKLYTRVLVVRALSG
jgi:hypothetical protein